MALISNTFISWRVTLISYYKVFLKNNQIYLYNTKSRRLLSHYNWTSNYFDGPESFPGHLDEMKKKKKYKFPLFTLGSIYSTNASRAEQIPETNKLNPT